MSFSGDLEHLSIVDVIQLLYTTRKSGILRVQGRKGESQLIFNDGYISSASHLNNSLRIGEILVNSNLITHDIVDQAMIEQKNAGQERKPFIVTLLEKGLVNEDEAYKGLESLIEMTIIEILTWKKGTFLLETIDQSVADDYRYCPNDTGIEINIDTQSVLMDALRIFDEKMRDGELEEDLSEDDMSAEEMEPLLSADDLGLTDIDLLERNIPGVFSSLGESNYSNIQRLRIKKIGAILPEQEQKELLSLLQQFSDPGLSDGTQAQSVILLSSDELLIHCMTTACKHKSIPVFATSEQGDLEHIITQYLSKQTMPLLIFDQPDKPEGISETDLIPLRRQILQQHPQIPSIQLVSTLDYTFALHAFSDGIRAVIPTPSIEERKPSFISDIKIFLESFMSYVQGTFPRPENQATIALKSHISALKGPKTPPEVALALLKCIADIFKRSLTLIVHGTELVAEKSIGIKAGEDRKVTPSLGFKIPLTAPSLLRTVVEEGHIFLAPTDDALVQQYLFKAIGVPCHSTILLLPLRSFGKTIALTYADFNQNEGPSVPADLLKILAIHASLVLENSYYQKKRRMA